MLLDRINLQRKLEAFRNTEISGEDILEQVKKILGEEENKEDQILLRFQEEGSLSSNNLKFDLLEGSRIFHTSHIRRLAITYRLRFLETRYFKASIPREALHQIKKLEKDHQICLSGFQILAPASQFQLNNADDPLLFAPIGNDYYLLVHKWGNDLHPLRKLLVWPLRSFEKLLIFCVLLSFPVTLGFREIFYSQYQEVSQFFILYLFTFKSVIGIILFYGIALGKNFSSSIWKSRYFNG